MTNLGTINNKTYELIRAINSGRLDIDTIPNTFSDSMYQMLIYAIARLCAEDYLIYIPTKFTKVCDIPMYSKEYKLITMIKNILVNGNYNKQKLITELYNLYKKLDTLEEEDTNAMYY